jgi:hypothetical protein
MENPYDKEGVAEAHRRWLPTVRRAEEAAAVAFLLWGRLR